MHEMSLVRHMFGIMEDELRKHGMSRVRKVVLKVGALSGAVPRNMEDAFLAYSKDTFAEGAVLEIELDKAEGRCRECGDTFPVEDFIFQCPRCEAVGGEVERGRGIEVRSLDLEE